jgi:hypothetical protein
MYIGPGHIWDASYYMYVALIMADKAINTNTNTNTGPDTCCPALALGCAYSRLVG